MIATSSNFLGKTSKCCFIFYVDDYVGIHLSLHQMYCYY